MRGSFAVRGLFGGSFMGRFVAPVGGRRVGQLSWHDAPQRDRSLLRPPCPGSSLQGNSPRGSSPRAVPSSSIWTERAKPCMKNRCMLPYCHAGPAAGVSPPAAARRRKQAWMSNGPPPRTPSPPPSSGTGRPAATGWRWCCRAAAHSAPTRRGSTRPCTKPVSSPNSSPGYRSAPSTGRSSPATRRNTASIGCAASGRRSPPAPPAPGPGPSRSTATSRGAR